MSLAADDNKSLNDTLTLGLSAYVIRVHVWSNARSKIKEHGEIMS